MAVSTRPPSATQREKPYWLPKDFESCVTGTMTYCSNPLLSWRIFSQSSPSRKNPSPVASLREAPPSPTRGEGRKSALSCNDPLPHPPAGADAFPQLSGGEPAGARRCRGAGRAERRRQDQLPGGDLVSVAGTRP